MVVLSDTYNFATGVPALTWQLRGLVQVDVEVTCLGRPVHSGDFGGAMPDAVRILCRLLDDLRAEDGRIAVPGLYKDVVKPAPSVRRRLARLPFSAAAFRRGAGMLPGTRTRARARGERLRAALDAPVAHRDRDRGAPAARRRQPGARLRARAALDAHRAEHGPA